MSDTSKYKVLQNVDTEEFKRGRVSSLFTIPSTHSELFLDSGNLRTDDDTKHLFDRLKDGLKLIGPRVQDSLETTSYQVYTIPSTQDYRNATFQFILVPLRTTINGELSVVWSDAKPKVLQALKKIDEVLDRIAQERRDAVNQVWEGATGTTAEQGPASLIRGFAGLGRRRKSRKTIRKNRSRKTRKSDA
jgi:hypothetical protein